MKHMKISFVCKRKLKRLKRKYHLVVPNHFSIGFNKNMELFSINLDTISYHSDKIIIDRNMFLSLVVNELIPENFLRVIDLSKKDIAEVSISDRTPTYWKQWPYVIFQNKNQFLKAKMKI